jgi:hypothetical protein
MHWGLCPTCRLIFCCMIGYLNEINMVINIQTFVQTHLLGFIRSKISDGIDKMVFFCYIPMSLYDVDEVNNRHFLLICSVLVK